MKMMRVVLVSVCVMCCLGWSLAAFAEEKSPNRRASERLIVKIDVSSWIEESFTISPDSRRVAYGAGAGKKRFVVVDGKKDKPYDGIGEGTPIFSPDSRRVAYTAGASKTWFVVVDGKEDKRYDGCSILIFSPDSQRVAYRATAGNKRFVVVDGKEGKPYDDIVNRGGGRIVFDSSDSLHYLALKGNGIYLVEERL
jgi:hypothetical protein